MGFPNVFTLTLISSSIFLLKFVEPTNRNGIKFQINLEPTTEFKCPVDDSNTNYTLENVNPAVAQNQLLHIAGITLIGQGVEEEQKAKSLRCVDPSQLLDNFITLMPNKTATIPVFYRSPLSVTLGEKNQSIVVVSPIGSKTYGNGRSIPLKAGNGNFVLQILCEMNELGKMDLYILSHEKQSSQTLVESLKRELEAEHKLKMTVEDCPDASEGTTSTTRGTTPTSRGNEQGSSPTETTKNDGYNLRPSSILIAFSITSILLGIKKF